MTRVAVVYHFLPHYRSAVFRELRSTAGFEFSFIAGQSRPHQENVPCDTSTPTTTVRNRWRKHHLLWQQGLGRALRDIDPHVTIFLGDFRFVSTWVWAPILRLRGRTVLFWGHGWSGPDTAPKSWVRRAFYALPHQLLLYAKQAQTQGLATGYPPHKLRVVGNSLPMALLSDDSFERVQGDPPLILWVARLSALKRPEMLIEALSLLLSEQVEFEATIVGDGEQLEVLNALLAADKALADRISLLGAVHEPAVLDDLFSRCSVLALPSNAGLSVVHALSRGVPVVLNDDPLANGPEYEYLIDDLNGSTFEQGNAADLAKELKRWTHDEPASSVQRQRIAENLAGSTSPELNAAAILSAISDALEERGLPKRHRLRSR